MSNETKQTALDWYDNLFKEMRKLFGMYHNFLISIEEFETKKFELKTKYKKQIKLPIHIHEGIENTLVYIKDGVIHVKPNTEDFIKIEGGKNNSISGYKIIENLVNGGNKSDGIYKETYGDNK
jgi:hypothetical protein